MTIGIEGRGGAEVVAPGPLVPIEYTALQLAEIEQLTWTDVGDHTIIRRTEGDTPIDVWIWASGSSKPDGNFGFALTARANGFSDQRVTRYIQEFAASYNGIEWSKDDDDNPRYIISTEVGNYLLWAQSDDGALWLNTMGNITSENSQLTNLRHGTHNSSRSFADFADVSGRLIGGCSTRIPGSIEMPRLNIDFELPAAEPQEKAVPTKALAIIESKEQPPDVRVPKLRFHDVGGLMRAKEALGRVADAYYHPEPYQKFGLKIPRTILLKGEATSGKQMLAEAFAGEIGAIHEVSLPANIFKRFVGESERSIQEIFSAAKEQANDKQAVVLVFPHIDTLLESQGASDGGTSARVAEQLESEIKQLVREDKDVFVVATTRRIGELAHANLFNVSIEVAATSLEDRAQLIGHFIARQEGPAFILEQTDPVKIAEALSHEGSSNILRTLNTLVRQLVEKEVMTGKEQKAYDTVTAIEAIKKLRTT